ncbi:hypothetical protein BU26DRAFT_518569 [Trematosphaeria pertusa]|uniref:Uncharacterized protein n=1 Tax=Trematosphaeria pertusa TaxID=390896 RepID=A0A6A6IKN6_9PLEO|nr:uncharacterized protein BU26DRAFT_518569 [Trematosphaeria pertusa]KAF2250130.1 hypothetical protein BU26DRAFT_518569 [Trematosphaeria pertusa]
MHADRATRATRRPISHPTAITTLHVSVPRSKQPHPTPTPYNPNATPRAAPIKPPLPPSSKDEPLTHTRSSRR